MREKYKVGEGLLFSLREFSLPIRFSQWEKTACRHCCSRSNYKNNKEQSMHLGKTRLEVDAFRLFKIKHPLFMIYQECGKVTNKILP